MLLLIKYAQIWKGPPIVEKETGHEYGPLEAYY